VEALNRKCHELITNSGGEHEVSSDETFPKGRVKKVHATTAKNALVCASIRVAGRPNHG